MIACGNYGRDNGLPIIGLAGRKGAGKDTAASLIQQHMRGWERIAFADPIRAALSAMLEGFNFGYHLTPERKEQPIPGLHGQSARSLAQTLGTEWGRDCVHPDLWITLAMRQLDIAEQCDATGAVITDVRFPNEAKVIRASGGRVWWIEPNDRLPGTTDAHRSESSLSVHDIDRCIPNDTDIGDLGLRILQALAEDDYLRDTPPAGVDRPVGPSDAHLAAMIAVWSEFGR